MEEPSTMNGTPSSTESSSSAIIEHETTNDATNNEPAHESTNDIIESPNPLRRISQASTRSSQSSNGRPSSILKRSREPSPHHNHRRSRSFRGSLSRVGQSITWSQLARRRSTELDERRNSNLSDEEYNGNVEDVKKSSCWTSFRQSMVHRRQSIVLSIKKAGKHPKSIVLPTVLTFAILTAAGLFAIFYSSHQYRETQSELLLNESRELAYLLDDLLSKALLPLYTLKEMALQFTQFTALRNEIVQLPTYYTEDGRAFRNATGVCTKENVLGLYWKAAESIVGDSRMEDVLLNVQLQPGEDLC
jgi:hypothetical protein